MVYLKTFKEVDIMDKRTKMIMLYDYYQNLLTEKQRKYFESYYFDNYSLSEISESNNISRNGVYNIIKKSENKLLHYERQLELLSKRNRIYNKIEKIDDKEIKDMIIKVLEDI